MIACEKVGNKFGTDFCDICFNVTIRGSQYMHTERDVCPENEVALLTFLPPVSIYMRQ